MTRLNAAETRIGPDHGHDLVCRQGAEKQKPLRMTLSVLFINMLSVSSSFSQTGVSSWRLSRAAQLCGSLALIWLDLQPKQALKRVEKGWTPVSVTTASRGMSCAPGKMLGTRASSKPIPIARGWRFCAASRARVRSKYPAP